ncbi:DNA-binding transcriptional regulator LsrR (DeoR family) [Nocardiopsis mwathae]|uniref:DNA-binding transcriptional regulator LsrR (DeoR family) n=1 Tax=Nocardiopsis mwathae TaxID=1472723 RepID=A0A7W9YFR2_9ACTN|nr:sugar-binding domain-containing protein [Nocardiopsis mwathae]MBB6171340.1 DNA-binding transcriptional regulator LsrR (DeoR family) [Nocardiopsis mwathae]
MATGAPALRPAELIRAAAIARRYYIDGVSKLHIAQEFGISRFKVARILDDARAAHIIRFDISVPAEIDAELSDALRSAYGLREAIAVATADDRDSLHRDNLGRLAADYLTEVLGEGDTLGLACSRTLNAMTLALGALPRCTVVQLTGVLPGGVEENSVELVRRVASLARGPVFPIYAPLVVPDPATARALRRQPQVADTMRRYADLTKAVVAIGSWEPPASLVRDALPPGEGALLSHHGVRAEVCARLMDGDGVPIATDLTDRTIAITVDQLKQVPEVVAVAGGADKTAAIRSALKAGFITSLVTDAATARALTQGG